MDPWQLSLKYSNSGTELLSDLVSRFEHGGPFAWSFGFESLPLNCLTVTFSPLFFLVFISHLSFSLTSIGPGDLTHTHAHVAHRLPNVINVCNIKSQSDIYSPYIIYPVLQ